MSSTRGPTPPAWSGRVARRRGRKGCWPGVATATPARRSGWLPGGVECWRALVRTVALRRQQQPERIGPRLRVVVDVADERRLATHDRAGREDPPQRLAGDR